MGTIRRAMCSAVRLAVRVAATGIFALVAVIIALLCFAFDYRSNRFDAFKREPMLEQLATRHCPSAGNVPLIDRGSLAESYRLGPYSLTVPDGGYREIQGYLTQRVGDDEVVDGVSRRLQADRTFLRFRALGPDMLGGAFAHSDYRREVARGNLYDLDITILWSRGSQSVPLRFIRSYLPTGPVTDTPIDLVVQDLGHRSGRVFRLFPKAEIERTYAIDCWLPYDGGSGTCDVVRRAQDNVWIAYSFGSENLACWRGIDASIGRFLSLATAGWRKGEDDR